MIRAQNVKALVVIKQQSATTATTLTSDLIDTRGFDYLSLFVHATTADAVTNKPSVLKLQESDDTVATNFADITLAVGDGVGGFVLPNSPIATTTKAYAKFDADLTGRKRYIRLLITPRTAQTFSALGFLHRPKELPNTTTESNADVLIVL